jgi:hypothetical protein
VRPRIGAVGDLFDRSRQPHWHGAFSQQQQPAAILDPFAAGRPDHCQDATVNTVMNARNMTK